MMMPPPEVFRVENALSDILPHATTISLSDNKLTLEGSGGKIVAQKTD